MGCAECRAGNNRMRFSALLFGLMRISHTHIHTQVNGWLRSLLDIAAARQTNRLWERPLTFIKTKMVCNQLGKNGTHWWSLARRRLIFTDMRRRHRRRNLLLADDIWIAPQTTMHTHSHVCVYFLLSAAKGLQLLIL
jgi:hypothetical protein